MKLFKVKIFLLAISGFSLSSAKLDANGNGHCVENISVSTTDTTIKLNWDALCDSNEIDIYKIHYSHENYRACKDGRKDLNKGSGFGTVEQITTEVLIENLHPYSNYSVEIKVLMKGRRRRRPEIHNVMAVTQYGIPKAVAQKSNLDYSYQNTADMLVFNWSPPLLASKCHIFNSHLGSFIYKLRGVDAWNREEIREDVLDLSETLVKITHLKPYSNYIFQLFLANDANEYDGDVYLKLEGRTNSTVPDPPEMKTVSTLSLGTVHMEWLPAFPLKGELSHYEMRWTLDEFMRTRTTWLNHQRVELGDALCSEDHPEPSTACHTLSDLDPGNYTFQIRTFNKGVPRPSEWSDDMIIRIGDNIVQRSNNTPLIAFAFIAVIILILSIISFFFFKKIKRDKKGYLPANQGDQNGSIIKNGTVNFSDTSSFLLRHHGGLDTRSRSMQDPLPDLPCENIYSDLHPKAEEKVKLEEDEDQYLKPNGPGYLPRMESKDSLDEEGYLKPNFNRFQRLDTSGSDQVEPSMPTIPPVSYMSGRPSQV